MGSQLPKLGFADDNVACELQGSCQLLEAPLDRWTATCFNPQMEERARRILDAAIELAEQGGFEAVRLRDVAAQANVALGTLYRRFRSKRKRTDSPAKASSDSERSCQTSDCWAGSSVSRRSSVQSAPAQTETAKVTLPSPLLSGSTP